MINMHERTKLELEFCHGLDHAMNWLVREDFPESDVEAFIIAVKKYLEYPNIRDYVKAALYDKTRELSKIFSVIDKGIYYSYRKFIAILISLNEPEIVEMLETSFVKEKNLDNFFILIEEEVKQNKNIANCEKLFISLMTLQNYELSIIDRFLQAINKNRTYLVTKLIELKSYSTLRKYIEELAITDAPSFKNLVPIIIEKYEDRIGSHYLDLIKIIVTYSTEFTDRLLLSQNLNRMFEKHILSGYIKMSLIRNYSQYLLSKNELRFYIFEKTFLDHANSDELVEYAEHIPYSNKRLVLRRLIELKDSDEESLVDFIRKFPEYENLLPLL